MKMDIREVKTVGILETDDLKASFGAVAGIALWSIDTDDIAGPVVSNPDNVILFHSLESLRGVTLALIGICGQLGIHPDGLH